METDRRLIMVTGANKGIGLGLIKSLLKTHPQYHFLMCVRSLQRGKTAFDELKKEVPDTESRVQLRALDISSAESVSEFAEWVKASKMQVDCLINNAAVLIRTEEVNEKVVSQTFPINYYGTVGLTEKMLPLMKDESKIIMVTSSLGSYGNLSDCTLKEKPQNPMLTRIELMEIVDEFCREAKDNKFPVRSGEYPVYSFTKLVLNHYTQVLAGEKQVTDGGIQVYACTPGWAQTDIGGPGARLTIEEGIACPCYVLSLPWKIDKKYQGKFFHYCKVKDVLA
eukprot:TRINITY_DN103_c0_g1_i1.p1 TRINITY_DN103_c0_g1~~TRINITY_DN103_c0_g1_i1.p1  ORF type:complete len:281 (-),score=37.97 TRINITY_DN103_c0_g1_i1:53-895(-)